MSCIADCKYCNPPEVHCAHCLALIPYAPNGGNLVGGMRVTFQGWYGGTIDPFPRGVEAILCDTCARATLAANPWLAAVSPDLRVR